MDFIDSKLKKLFYVLLGIEAMIMTFSILGGSFLSAVMMTILRVLLLIVSYCCVQSTWGAMYSVFALISGVYFFDPVGLFLTGHGDKKTTVQNIACIAAFALCLVASYVGYLYTGELQHEEHIPVGQNYDDNENNLQGNSNPFAFQSSPSEPQNPYLYQRGPNAAGNTSSNRQEQWRPFTGEGYSLS